MQILSLFSSSHCFQESSVGTTLAVQWLRFHTPNAGSMGLIPEWGTKTLDATALCSRNNNVLNMACPARHAWVSFWDHSQFPPPLLSRAHFPGTAPAPGSTHLNIPSPSAPAVGHLFILRSQFFTEAFPEPSVAKFSYLILRDSFYTAFMTLLPVLISSLRLQFFHGWQSPLVIRKAHEDRNHKYFCPALYLLPQHTCLEVRYSSICKWMRPG